MRWTPVPGRSTCPRLLVVCITLGVFGSLPIDRATGQETESPTETINRLIREGWELAEVSPSPQTDDPEFLRRLSLDLIGRTPTVEEVVSFIRDKRGDKRARLIDLLLDHPDFAKNSANLWEVILIGRADQGNQVNREAFRTWLTEQFNDERPWNEIARELITATGSNTAENGATNFVLAHREMNAVPLTSVTTRVFLGRQLQCTQCHDHKSNDWKQEDFWGINAFFRGIRVQRDNGDGAMVEVTDDPTSDYARFDRPDGSIRIAFPKYLDGRKVSQSADINRRSMLGDFITDRSNTEFAEAFVNRVWGHFMGRGIVHPVDDFGDHNPPSHPELIASLTQSFIDADYDIKELVRWITSSEAYLISSARGRSRRPEDALFATMIVKPMTPEQLFSSLLVATQADQTGDGDAQERRDRWRRQFVFAFANDEATEQNSFDGTIPQALMMMNGNLIREATSCKPGNLLHKVVGGAVQRGAADTIVTQLYLATLSRPPSKTEARAAGMILRNAPNPYEASEDLFWALLNSNEFMLNH